jgi:hypothetical protein
LRNKAKMSHAIQPRYKIEKILYNTSKLKYFFILDLLTTVSQRMR